MRVVRTVSEIRTLRRAARRAEDSVGFVATMGALHAGHLSLVRAARAVDDEVIVSIFVNPLQFGPQEDYTAYPRDEASDVAALAGAGGDVVFIPEVGEMYPAENTTTIDVGGIGRVFEGESRPGHFTGVCTVVAKLFNIIEPDRALFGQKDAQQVAVVKRMVRDLNFGVEIVVCPTVREPDGLAMSSRNAYLSPTERRQASALSRALAAGMEALHSSGGPAAAEREMRSVLEEASGVEPDYAAARDPDTFDPPRTGGPVLLVVAARVGRARLIDNMLFEPG